MAVSSTDQESVVHIGRAALFGPFVFVVGFAAVGWCSAEAAASVSYDHGPVLVGCEDSGGAAHGEVKRPGFCGGWVLPTAVAVGTCL